MADSLIITFQKVVALLTPLVAAAEKDHNDASLYKLETLYRDLLKEYGPPNPEIVDFLNGCRFKMILPDGYQANVGPEMLAVSQDGHSPRPALKSIEKNPIRNIIDNGQRDQTWAGEFIDKAVVGGAGRTVLLQSGRQDPSIKAGELRHHSHSGTCPECKEHGSHETDERITSPSSRATNRPSGRGRPPK